jgi:hypothetical protein
VSPGRRAANSTGSPVQYSLHHSLAATTGACADTTSESPIRKKDLKSPGQIAKFLVVRALLEMASKSHRHASIQEDPT